MIRDDAHWLALVDAFQAAAISGDGWYAALEALAEATGSRSGELVGFGSDKAISFNIMTNVDPGLIEEFQATGGGDPEHNPKLKAGLRTPVLQVMAESDFITPDEHKRHPHYHMARRWGIPYSGLVTLEKNDGVLIGLGVFRSEKQGHITSEQRAYLAALAPHIRAAVRTQMALEGQGNALLAGTLDALYMAAFICDGAGRVKAVTSKGETLLLQNPGLRLKAEQLSAADPASDQALNQTIMAAARGQPQPGMPLARTLVVRSPQPGDPLLVLDVIALPRRRFEFSFAPRVLVVARQGRRDARQKAQILQMAHGLTQAEVDIAMRLAQGRSIDAIAQERQVAVSTVRSQVKVILGKLDLRKQIELVSRLNEL